MIILLKGYKINIGEQNMIKSEFKLIDETQNKKAFNELAEQFIMAKQQIDEYTPIKNKAYAKMQEIVKAEFNLPEIESAGKYQTLEYLMEFKKASESMKLDEDMLKTKYPEIYKECLVKKVNKPALLKIEEIKI